MSHLILREWQKQSWNRQGCLFLRPGSVSALAACIWLGYLQLQDGCLFQFLQERKFLKCRAFHANLKQSCKPHWLIILPLCGSFRSFCSIHTLCIREVLFLPGRQSEVQHFVWRAFAGHSLETQGFELAIYKSILIFSITVEHLDKHFSHYRIGIMFKSL